MTVAPIRTGTVPYIAPWSGEAASAASVTGTAAGGVAFVFESPQDRDSFGVLWNSRGDARGEGEPEYANVHPQRQREVMQELLCQVCGGRADQDDRGALWLLEDNRADWHGWPNDLLTTHPPVCLPCAGQAARGCPHLRRGSVAVRVGSSEVCAVYGRRYALVGRRLIRGDYDVVSYTSPNVRWVVAGQLVRSLADCTIVDLQAELGGRT
ncbi:hypothetical protein [Streptomyces sp. NBC_01373]|uniref:hypothetical protein n=1 Tax=Streptomyces sp. NBC_01373 TaxID=2903843 RepID=UPI002251FCAE|nr:hypothetical protein [Streptomyces sp. NBC_01373]MCX4705630.1 hypothetical protein [Streptomyces sp. NBC_01373]